MSDIDQALVIRLETTLAKFERQLKRATSVTRRETSAMQAATDRSMKRMAAQSNAAAASLTRFVTVGRRGTFVLQNTAAQIGDIAIQLEGGTSAARVMGQQLPQLLGGFGALGGILGTIAPLLSVLLAVGIPLGAMFMRSGASAEEAAAKVETFADKIKAAESAVSKAQAAIDVMSEEGLKTLRDRYGELTDAVKDLVRELANIEIEMARTKVSGLVDAALGDDFSEQLKDVFGNLGADIADETKEALRLAQAEYDELANSISQREQLGGFVSPAEREILADMRQEIALLSGDLEDAGNLAGELKFDPEVLVQIMRLRDGIREALEAGDFSSVADSLSRMREMLAGLGADLGPALHENLLLAEEQARLLAKDMDDAAVAADNLAAADPAVGIAGAADEAARLAENLGLSLDLANQVAAAAKAQGTVGLDAFGGYGDWRLDQPQTIRPPRAQPAGRRASSGGSGGRGISEQIDALRATLEPAGAALRQFIAAEELLDRALSQGAVSQTEHNRLLADAARKLGNSAKDASTYAAIVERLNGLLASGAITQQEYNVAMQSARGAFQAAGGGLDKFGRYLDSIADGLLSVIDGTKTMGEVFGSVLRQMAGELMRTSIRGLFSSLFGGVFASADGNVFAGGRSVAAFADGGVVSGPTVFPMRGGRTGLMGEAGPEAIMPLTRIGGKLGVLATGGAGGRVDVVVHVDEGGNWQAAVARIAGAVSARVTGAGLERQRHGFDALAAALDARGTS